MKFRSLLFFQKIEDCLAKYQVLRSQHNIILKGTQMDPQGQNSVTIYISMRQIQDYVICKPEFLELVTIFVLQMPFL